MLVDLCIALLSLFERFVKKNLALGWLFLGSTGAIESSVLVMDYLEWMLARLLHGSVYCTTIKARSSFPALDVDLLAYLCPTKVINVRSTEVSEEGSSLILRK